MVTQPTPITDKNGKQTTVHKKADAPVKGGRVSAVAPVAAKPTDSPISTEEIRAAIASLPDYPNGKDERGERDRIRTENRFATNQLEKRWGAWLADEYASDVPAAAHAEIYRMAWDDGHSSGYEEVENRYQEYADFARKVANAVRG